jgi:2'-5' RNA ligase
MSTTVRSFIAMDLPASVVCRLEDAQQGLKALKLRAKWVRPENIHLTLKFLGNVSAGQIDAIASAMARAVDDQAALVLALRGVGFFPGIKRARVIWMGLGGQIQRLFALQRTLEEQLAAIGFAMEKRPFKGHLTLGRIQQTVAPHVMRRVMDDYLNFSGDEFIAGRICLFQSDLQPSGPVYSRLKQVDLNNGADF